ncbi:acyltransferase [Pseudonocardia sp.]|jgi:acetyltransferase-like isoleucine patch superfamily enzyme|uniref:acyltransferase n=1 Tax=Pseudonocardia sp. TaxID=60912 RepID=UPI0031FD09E3
MRLLDRLITRALRGPLDALVADQVAKQVQELKLDALYSYRWHGDRSRLHIPDTAIVNNALFNMSGGTISLGEHAFFGHDVAVLTGTHDINQFGRARQLAFPRSGRDVVIGEGVWLASHVLVLGPVTIGEHAVVAAGSLVREDVEPYTVVAGRPAKVIKKITPPTA